MASRAMEQFAGMDVDVFTGMVLAAVSVAYADGMVETSENRVMTDAILELTGGHFSHTDIQRLLDAALKEVVATGVDESLERAAGRISEPMRPVAMIFASAVAWSARGVSKTEEARLEQLAGLLDLDQQRYTELRTAGKELAASSKP